MQNLARSSDEVELLNLLEEELAYNASQSLDKYCRFIDVPGAPVSDNEDEEEFYPETIEPAAHHQLINAKLEKVEQGGLKRLMILMPPGSAKSTYASVVFPTYFMGKKRRRSVIGVSYGSDLAKRFGRKCRQVVRSDKYRQVFGAELSSDNKATDDWGLDNESQYMGFGLLAGVTGNRADGIVCDDPVKGREDADSQLIRDKAWEAWLSDVRTRLKPGGFIILIQTRWHEDDIAGRILPEDYNGESGLITGQDGEVWDVLSLPAECEHADDPLGRAIGEYLWTEWFSVEHWKQERRTQGARNWSSLFQQRPAPDEGTFFKREWFKRFNLGEEPATNKYLSSDFAVSKSEGDFTELGILGVSVESDLYALDWWYEQETPDVWIDAELDLIKKHKPYAAFGEKGQIRKSIEPFLSKRSRERKIYCRFEWIARTADKMASARAFQGMASMGKVLIPNTSWGDRLIDQLVSFPAGKHDDGVDVCSLLGMAIDQAHPAILEKPPAEPKKDAWGRIKRTPKGWKSS